MDYLILMHNDNVAAEAVDSWQSYIGTLIEKGVFAGGSAIGGGATFRKAGAAGTMSDHLTGFIRVTAENLDAARLLLEGNPVFEAGGSVEIRELPPG